MRADFQRFYGLDLDALGAEYTHEHAAALAAHLPYGSALCREVDPSQEWTPAEYLLARIEYGVRCSLYSGKGPKPKPLSTPADRARRPCARMASRSEMKRVADILGIPEDRR